MFTSTALAQSASVDLDKTLVRVRVIAVGNSAVLLQVVAVPLQSSPHILDQRGISLGVEFVEERINRLHSVGNRHWLVKGLLSPGLGRTISWNFWANRIHLVALHGLRKLIALFLLRAGGGAHTRAEEASEADWGSNRNVHSLLPEGGHLLRWQSGFESEFSSHSELIHIVSSKNVYELIIDLQILV